MSYIKLFVQGLAKKVAKLPFTPAQCRAARGLINWNQGDLARAAGVSRQTINDFESGKREPIHNNLAAIAVALITAGIRPIGDGESGTNGEPEGLGVRFFRPEGQQPKDPQGIKLIGDVVLDFLKRRQL